MKMAPYLSHGPPSAALEERPDSIPAGLHMSEEMGLRVLLPEHSGLCLGGRGPGGSLPPHCPTRYSSTLILGSSSSVYEFRNFMLIKGKHMTKAGSNTKQALFGEHLDRLACRRGSPQQAAFQR